MLVTRPDLLTDMMCNEDIYAKAGSQKKIPWGVVLSLMGDNIINSHSDDWKLYTSAMKSASKKPFFLDSKPLLKKSRVFVSLLLKYQEKAGPCGSVLVNSLIQRFAIAAMGESFLDIDFQVSLPEHELHEENLAKWQSQCLGNPGMRIEVMQSIIKRTTFKPLFFQLSRTG